MSVIGLLHRFKQVELHLISKTVKAMWDKEFCESRSQNVPVHISTQNVLVQSLTMVFTSGKA